MLSYNLWSVYNNLITYSYSKLKIKQRLWLVDAVKLMDWNGSHLSVDRMLHSVECVNELVV